MLQKKGKFNAGQSWRLLRPVVYGVLTGSAVILSLLYLAALLITWKRSIPEGILGGLATVILCIAAFAGAAVAALLSRARGMFYGVITGALLALLVYIVGAGVYAFENTAVTFVKPLMMALCGAASGALVVNRRPKVRF